MSPELAEALAQGTVEVLVGPPHKPVSTAARPTRERRRWHRQAYSPRTGRLAGLLVFAGFVAGGAVEPAANGPDPVLPFWADALFTATLVALLGCWVALAAGRRSGLWLGAVAGGGLFAMTVACPAVDHHTIAGWWWAQLAISVGIVALTVGLLAGTRAGGADAPTEVRRPGP
jgi:hypothetical protein